MDVAALGPSAALVDDVLVAALGGADVDVHEPPPLQTGLPAFDDALGGGLRQGEVVLVAGRPLGGACELTLAVAANAAVNLGIPTGILASTIGAREAVRWLVGIIADVAVRKIAGGTLDERERVRVEDAAARLAAAPLHVRDAPGAALEHLQGLCSALGGGPTLLVVLGLSRLAGDFPDEREPLRAAVDALHDPLPDIAPAILASVDLPAPDDDDREYVDLRWLGAEVDDVRRLGMSEDDAAALVIVGRSLCHDPDARRCEARVDVYPQRGPRRCLPALFDWRSGRLETT
jgi:hypothetical protein